MSDINNSIIGNPASWGSKPEDVARREREMRDGITAYRQQQAEERQRTQEVAKAILTPEPAKPSPGFAERYALTVDTTTGETFLLPDPQGDVVLGPQGEAIADRGNGIPHAPRYGIAFYAPDGFGQDDDPGS